MIPYTSTLFVENKSVVNDIEITSQQPLSRIPYLLCRTIGRSEVRGGYWDYEGLKAWVDAKGTDPVTREPINWNEYEAVFLNVPEEPLSIKLLREACYYETEIALLKLQGKSLTIKEREDIRYKSFRRLMLYLFQEHVYDICPWMYDYWVNHPYIPEKDEIYIQRIDRLVQHLSLVKGDEPKSFVNFRHAMASLINTRRFENPNERALVRLYWHCHPISHNTDSSIALGRYNMEATKYNETTNRTDYRIFGQRHTSSL